MPSFSATNRNTARHHRAHLGWSTSLVALLVLGAMLSLMVGGAGAATPVSLGTANTFAVLAGAGITNTGPTVVNGDIGTYPTPAITSTGGLAQIGTVHAADAVAQQPQSDLT